MNQMNKFFHNKLARSEENSSSMDSKNEYLCLLFEQKKEEWKRNGSDWSIELIQFTVECSIYAWNEWRSNKGKQYIF